MRAFCVALSVSIMFWVIPAFTQSIKSDYDTSYDFSKLKTYDFVPHNPQSQGTFLDNSLNDKRMKSELESRLKANGFSKPEAGKPDFLIAPSIAGRPVTTVESRSLPPVGRRGGPGGTIAVPKRSFEATVMLDFFDGTSNQLIWRGFASDPIDPSKPQKLITKGIENMIKRFMKDAGRKHQ